MTAAFNLIITADNANLCAEFDLRDANGVQLAYRQTDFNTLSISAQRSLFDLRNYLRHYVEPSQEAEAIAQVGVCIAEQVLGKDLFLILYASSTPRTLRMQLPNASAETNHLAAALASVPWEIARPAADQPTLGERNLQLRVVHTAQELTPPKLNLQPDESLRVLFVFAEAPGSRPLAARVERQKLQELFAKEIYPVRRIVADFLTHGVTRQRLLQQLQENGGYHIVHWSGHGQLNLLELAKAGGGQDHLSGQALLELFTQAAVELPHLMFLSACHSGDTLRIQDWQAFNAAAKGEAAPSKDAHPDAIKDLNLEQQPGFTGTAHTLLQGGVPCVVAMRYAVGDEYARDLALEFYRALLALKQPKAVAAALTLARNNLLRAAQQRYTACDHATPILYATAQLALQPPTGRSPALAPRNPCLQKIPELSIAQHPHFVGRTWELATLGADFIGSDQQPVAVINGLGGMGKTALTAEVLALWQNHFEWVLLYQAKPNALSLENLLRDIDINLNAELGRYHDHVTTHRGDAIYRDDSAVGSGSARYAHLVGNLIRAMHDEAIFLVLDNFESNLKPAPVDPQAAEPLWACQDVEWDQCLARLARELRGTRSRVLITCRYPLQALHGAHCKRIPLGPLPAGEAALYLRDHASLQPLYFSADASEHALAVRLLNASRFHPLLMDRLARLAAGGLALRQQLLAALTTLEQANDFQQLPDLFNHEAGDSKEQDYLNNALQTSIEQLLQHLSADARRLLWMIAIANEPIELALLTSVWRGDEDKNTLMLRQIQEWLQNLSQQPPKAQEQLTALSPAICALLDNLPPAPPTRPDPTPLISQLLTLGLATEQRVSPEDDNPQLTCHELVRERICAWMAAQPSESDRLSANSIRLAYAEQLIIAFNALQNNNTSAALAFGSRALVYCVQAQAYQRLDAVASSVVTSNNDPRLLGALLPHLHSAVAAAPEGKARWSCLGYLADALSRSGRPDESLPFYQQAVAQARAAAESPAIDSAEAKQAWAAVSTISCNWANALGDVGHLVDAHQRQLESAEAAKNAGLPAIYVIGSELEALRIKFEQDEVASALPAIAAHLRQLEIWWQQQRAGHQIAAAPDPEYLARAYIAALDIANQAHCAQENWSAALPHLEALLAVKRGLGRPEEDIAGDRMNRANVLRKLNHYDEVQSELEACLAILQHDPAASARVLNSLAGLFAQQGDVNAAIQQARRALALCEHLPAPHERAISHHNLAIYLERKASATAMSTAPYHQLAGLLYRLVAGLQQDLQSSLNNYAVPFLRAHAADRDYAVPRIAELLADPAFQPLAQWLSQRAVDLDALQATVDELLEQARQAARQQQP